MFFGMRFGDYLGDPEVSAYYVKQERGARFVTFSFTPRHTGSERHVFKDGEYFAKTDGTEIEIPKNTEVRQWLQVFETSPQNADENLTRFANTPAHHVKLTWTASSDADYYEIYRSTVAGAVANGEVIARVEETGESSYTFTDVGDDGNGLDDGTYYYVVRAYDSAENYTDSSEINVTVNRAPEKVTGLTLSTS